MAKPYTQSVNREPFTFYSVFLFFTRSTYYSYQHFLSDLLRHNLQTGKCTLCSSQSFYKCTQSWNHCCNHGGERSIIPDDARKPVCSQAALRPLQTTSTSSSQCGICPCTSAVSRMPDRWTHRVVCGILYLTSFISDAFEMHPSRSVSVMRSFCCFSSHAGAGPQLPYAFSSWWIFEWLDIWVTRE